MVEDSSTKSSPKQVNPVKRTYSKTAATSGSSDGETPAQPPAHADNACNYESISNIPSIPATNVDADPSSAALSASERRISGNPAAKKRQFVTKLPMSVPDENNTNVEAPAAADAAAAAARNPRGDTAATESRGSLLSWAADVAEPDMSRSNSLLSSGVDCTDKTPRTSAVGTDHGSQVEGGSKRPQMDMRHAALQASQFWDSLSDIERGSIVLPGAGLDDSDISYSDEDQGGEGEQEDHQATRISEVSNIGAEAPRARRQSSFSAAATLHGINEDGNGDDIGKVMPSPLSPSRQMPNTDEELRRSQVAMEDQMNGLGLKEHVNERPRLERLVDNSSERTLHADNSSQELPTSSLDRQDTVGISNRSNKKVDEIAVSKLAAESGKAGEAKTALSAYSLPLTLSAPPPPSPLETIMAGLPALVRQTSSNALQLKDTFSYSSFTHGTARIASHVLLATLRYLGEHFPNANISCRDLMPSPNAWCIQPKIGTRLKGQALSAGEDSDIPQFLRAAGYKFGYERRCDVMFSPGSSVTTKWFESVTAMSSLSFLYCSKYPLAIGPDDSDASFQDDLVLYAFVAEHRSHVPHYTKLGTAAREEINGATQVTNARDDSSCDDTSTTDNSTKRSEKLKATKPEIQDAKSIGRMLRNGGAEMFSAPLLDARNNNNYTLEILSGVTGNTYTYGDATEEETGPSHIGGSAGPSRRLPTVMVKPGSFPGLGADGGGNLNYYGVGRGVTKIALRLKDDGTICEETGEDQNAFHRGPTAGTKRKELNPEDDPQECLICNFRVLNPCLMQHKILEVTGFGTTSNHLMLLDPKEAGRIYVNGEYVTTFGEDKSIASTSPALFGYDLLNIPSIYQKDRLVISDYDLLKRAVGTLIQECLIDASQGAKEIGAKILNRLIHGTDSLIAAASKMGDNKGGKPVNVPCLESEVIANKNYDPVGISAKALATRFAIMYGRQGFPCLAGDKRYVKERLGAHRQAVVVSQRTLDVLRRGGLFDIAGTEDLIWFGNPSAHYSLQELGSTNAGLVQRALCLVNKAIDQVEGEQRIQEKDVLIAHSSDLCNGVLPVFSPSYACRRNTKTGTYLLNDHIFDYFSSEVNFLNSQGSDDDAKKIRLIGLFLVQQFPNANVLTNFVVGDS